MLGGVIARAFRWQKLLENGTYTCLDDLAWTVKIDALFVSRYYRLVLLAPRILVETILASRQPAQLTIKGLLGQFPADWAMQRFRFDTPRKVGTSRDSSLTATG